MNYKYILRFPIDTRQTIFYIISNLVRTDVEDSFMQCRPEDVGFRIDFGRKS